MEIIKLKKAKAIVFDCFKTLVSNTTEEWYVGDNYFNDVIGSYLAGLSPIWINKNNITRL